MNTFFRTLYNYDTNAASDETATVNNEPSKTRQEFADDSDINKIVERLGLGYEMPLNTTPPMQGDFTDLPDFRGAVTAIRNAEQIFGALPAKIRNRFENDPQQYIDFFHDPENKAEAIAMGLVKPPAPLDNVTTSTTTDPKGKTPLDEPKKN